ncbi:MAG: hypothetical protein AB7I18_01240 [Candidatus Berkiella sp.]
MAVEQEVSLDKPLKQLLKEFQVLKMQVDEKHRDPQTMNKLNKLKETLLIALEKKELESQNEIERSKLHKAKLIQKLMIFEQLHDEKMRNEIIKQMEEYNRIKRFRYAQLAGIQRNIQDIKKQ